MSLDVRLYPSGAVINNSIPDWPTNLGTVAPLGTDGFVWIANTQPRHGGTADTENNARDAIVDAHAETAGAA